jgi:hypothetical protein
VKVGILALMVLAGFCGCSTHPQQQTWVAGPIDSGAKRMSETEVVAVARELALERGFSLNDYQAPRLSFDPREQSWRLGFWEKPPGHPGGYLQIAVDDRTGRAELLPSR